MTILARLYLRASTEEQDATRAHDPVTAFAKERRLRIAGSYVENESGASLNRPELFRLLKDSQPGDVLLVEQVDRLSRLTDADWKKLRAEIAQRQVRVVALDLPTSHQLATATGDDFTGRMLEAINGMLLDMLAAVARKDYEDRRRRQAEGQAKAKEAGRYKGRPEDTKRNAAIAGMLSKGMSWSQVQAATGCSRATVAKIAERKRKSDAAAEAATRAEGGEASEEAVRVVISFPVRHPDMVPGGIRNMLKDNGLKRRGTTWKGMLRPGPLERMKESVPKEGGTIEVFED